MDASGGKLLLEVALTIAALLSCCVHCEVVTARGGGAKLATHLQSSRAGPSAACTSQVDDWCRRSKCGQLKPAANLSAFSTAGGGTVKAWRCYAPADLDGPDPESIPLLQRQRNTSAAGDYCTRSAEILAVLAKCDPSFHPPSPPPSPPPAGPVFELHTLAEPDAVCLDGSPAAFYLGIPEKRSSKWLIWGEGKAWCLSESECVARAKATDGRGGWHSSGWPSKSGCLPPTLPWGDAPCNPGGTPGQAWGCQLSNDCAKNPAFCDFNMVHLKTCDGGSWSGNRSSLSPSGLHYKGKTIVDATIRALRQSTSIKTATEIVIGGGSAGALGVYLQADYWLKQLNPTNDKKVAAVADCGFFQDWRNNTYHQGFVWMHSEEGMQSAVDPTCAAAHPQAQNLCLMAEHIAPFITTPLFALQAKFDSWQQGNICGSNCVGNTPTAAKEFQAFGDALVTKLQHTVLAKPQNGAFVDSCLHHCGGSDVYRNDNLTQAKALQLWYEYGSGALPENGRLVSRSTEYPCSACCTGKQPQSAPVSVAADIPLSINFEQHSPSESLMEQPHDWQAVMDAIDAFALVPNCHVVIGNATGELFAYQKGNVGEDTQMRLYSATKWVSGVTIMAMVEDGMLQLDDLASVYLPYWTTDPQDSRARVTLRHLLGFVSGFSGGSSCSGLDTSACTRLQYETASHATEPGERYVYNEVHINMASGIAVAASGGVPFAELMQRYVFDRVPGGMPQTRFTNELNPAAGAGLISTPRDYAQFLRAYFSHNLVSKAGRAEMEADQYPQAQRSAADGGWHYGLANWFVCPADVSEWGQRCLEEDVHQSGGAAGFRPTTDRRHQYYYQIAVEGIPGLTNQLTLQMHYAIKPVIDAQFT